MWVDSAARDVRAREGGPVGAVMGAGTRSCCCASFFKEVSAALVELLLRDDPQESKRRRPDSRLHRSGENVDDGSPASAVRRCPICDSNVANVFLERRVDLASGPEREKRKSSYNDRGPVLARYNDVNKRREDGTKYAFASMMAPICRGVQVALSSLALRGRGAESLTSRSQLPPSHGAWPGTMQSLGRSSQKMFDVRDDVPKLALDVELRFQRGTVRLVSLHTPLSRRSADVAAGVEHADARRRRRLRLDEDDLLEVAD